MKLVEILALELKEWPEDCEAIEQDRRGSCLYKFNGPAIATYVEAVADDADTAKVTCAQWQAERDRQKGGEWKRHRGGKQPVADDVLVEVRHRDGEFMQWRAREQDWNHVGGCGDIMQYRVIRHPQAEEVEVKDAPIGTLSYKVEIDTTEATKAIDDLSAKWDQIDGPLLWRDRIVELEAHEEDIQREIASLHARLTEEGFSLVRQYPSAQQPEPTLDMSDWRNWKAGDVVECTYSSCDNVYTEGKHYDVDHVTSEYAKVADDCGENSFCHINDDEEVKFRLVR